MTASWIVSRSKAAGSWLIEKVAGHLLGVALTAIGLPSVAAIFFLGFEPYPVPVSLIILVLLVLVFAVFGLVITRNKLRNAVRPKEFQDKDVEYFGLGWTLTGDVFFRNYKTLFSHDLSDTFLKGAVRGPRCVKCRHDAFSSVPENKCKYCGKQFSVEKLRAGFLDRFNAMASTKVIRTDPKEDLVEFIRREVYIEAQADTAETN